MVARGLNAGARTQPVEWETRWGRRFLTEDGIKGAEYGVEGTLKKIAGTASAQRCLRIGARPGG